MSDRRLATLIGILLFVVAGWPLLFLPVPPYQDLPDHLATVCVLLHPAGYPDFISNGWFKTNSVFIGLIYLISRFVGVILAGRLVCVLVVGLMALALPHFVLALTDRRRLLTGALFMAPMAHSWFVLMGMLGFALALPIGLFLLVLLARQSEQPTSKRAIGIAVVAVFLWMTHAVVLLIVALLAVLELLFGGRPNRSIRLVLGPLVPAVLLIAISVASHPTHAQGARWGRLDEVAYENNFNAIYSLWACEFFGLTPLSIGGLVPAVVLAFFAVRRAKESVTLFSGCALGALAGIYLLAPHTLPGFGYVRERAVPFLWAWALVHVPPQLPRWLVPTLVLACLGWSVGLGVDLFRAEADLDEFTAAAPGVPEGARMLMLNFEPHVSSRNTRSLLHASGMYTVLRGVKPQDLWADSPSMPIRYSHIPSFVEDPVSIRQFLDAARTPQAYCSAVRRAGLFEGDCQDEWRKSWAEFWSEARQRYDYLLLWGAPPQVEALIPSPYETSLRRGRLALWNRSSRIEQGR